MNYFILESIHNDPESHLIPFEDRDGAYLPVCTEHPSMMPDCVAKQLHNLEVRKIMNGYEMGIHPQDNYSIFRHSDRPVGFDEILF